MVKVDTSAKYIKMCASAKEVQYKWDFQPGDFVYDPVFDQVQIHLYDPPRDFTDYVWLPRQDQLQEMSVQFFMHNMSMSRFEALVRFLEWDVGCRQQSS